MSNAPEASIIMLVKNGERYLAESLTRVFAQVGVTFEVIAIDSGSTDRSRAILQQFPVHMHQIAPQAFNHGATRNLGAELAHADSQFLVYLTQDATPSDERWLANLLEPFAEDEAVAGVFSRHVPRAGSSPALVRQLTTVWQSGGRERLVKAMPDDPHIYLRDRLYYAYFSDTSSALRRRIWEQHPYRPLNFAEDADWADRVLQAGYKIVFEPASCVVHSHDYSVMEQFRQNVDHVAGMKTLFPDNVYSGYKHWLRLFGGIPGQVRQDWRYILSVEPYSRMPRRQQLYWMAHSPAWHAASAAGTWIGAHQDRLAPRLRRRLSRQETIRTRG